MNTFSYTELARIIEAKIVNTGARENFESISIDSRTIKPNELFWSIPGEKFDGNKFATGAAAKGASGVVISAGYEQAATGDSWFLQVPDTLKALQKWAQYRREQLSIPMIGITGTVGKTTVKEMTAAILSRKYRVGYTTGNLNGQVGVPLTIFSFSDTTEIGVVEMGISIPGEMSRLLPMVQPETVILTHISPVHMEFFGSMDQLFEEKTSIFAPGYSLKNALVCYNHDWNDRLRERIPVHPVFYGDGENVEYSITRFMDRGTEGSSFTVITPAGEIAIELPIPGRHNAINSLPAIMCGLMYGISEQDIAETLSTLQSVSMRMTVHKTGNVTVLNDAYNASPESMKAALETLTRMKGRRKVAILGDMLELGEFEEQAHKDLATDIMNNSVDVLITVGERMTHTADKSLKMGFSREKLISVADAESAADLISFLAEDGDLILLKGSRLLKLEIIEKRLMESHA